VFTDINTVKMLAGNCSLGAETVRVVPAEILAVIHSYKVPAGVVKGPAALTASPAGRLEFLFFFERIAFILFRIHEIKNKWGRLKPGVMPP